MQHAIYPGKPWYDTNGKRIQAHGASIFYENGTFYWYGEDKSKTSKKGKIWTWGVRCYSSVDLYNWKDEGHIIPPEPDNKKSILHPKRRLDRPHILKNPRTGKYVCWLKYCDKMHYSILTADHFLGPYQIEKEVLRPYGGKPGDFDLAQDEENGQAYIYFEDDHEKVLVARLAPDYLDVEGEAIVLYDRLKPPLAREGVTHFERSGKHYLLTSGMTGYLPNPSEVAIADDFMGPFTIQGDPHRNDSSCASFNSQISAVFRHPERPDLYIAAADRWVPEYVMTKERYELLLRVIGSRSDPSIKATMKERLKLLKMPMMGSADTSVADYVWLPIKFEEDHAYIDWHSEWKAEEENYHGKK